MTIRDHNPVLLKAERRARKSATVSAVIPTLNEAANLPHVFERIPECVDELIIVDGLSTDDTVAVARAIRPDVRIVMQDGRGKGNALACGFAAARGDIIVTLDSDGSTDPAEIPDFVAALLEGADLATGTRFAGGGKSHDITPLRSLGNRFIGRVLNFLYRTRHTDVCYGYNAFWADVSPVLDVDGGFEVEAMIICRAEKAGLNIAEVPSVEHERVHGESNLHPIRDGLRVMRTILRERFSRTPAGHKANRALDRPVTPHSSILYGLERAGEPPVTASVEVG